MSYTLDEARNIFPDTLAADIVPATTARFSQLNAEDQLALIWFAYLEMGKTITIAAPGAANMQFAESTLAQIQQLSFKNQSQVMCDLANRIDTPINRTYSTWSVNIKLGFWYRLGQLMEAGLVAPIPAAYRLSANASAVLETIRNVEAPQQITILRNTVVDMGYSFGNMDDYQRVAEPVVVPTAEADREDISIEGLDNRTINQYMRNLNANDFEALIQLFAEDGALQPPFKRPIVGKEAVLGFFREECQDLKLKPKNGVVEPSSAGYTKIKVTGTCQTPWFGNGVGMNVAWRFLLNPEGEIFFVAIDLLATAKELLNFRR
jgi:hypothetical protein